MVSQNGYYGANVTCVYTGAQSGPLVTYALGPGDNGATVTNNGTVSDSVLSLGAIQVITAGASIGYGGVSEYNTYSFLFAPIITIANNGTVNSSYSGMTAVSEGAPGVADGNGNDPSSAPNDHYQGRNAGIITVGNNGTVNISGSASGSYVLYLGGVAVPQVAGIYATSTGGAGAGDKSQTGAGGDGNSVTVTTAASSAITLTGQASAGIFALSGGGQGAGFSQVAQHNFSPGGDAGNVQVTHSGQIVATGNGSSNVGIFAMSAGGSGGATDSQYSGNGGDAGTVAVELTGTGLVNVSGTQSMGVFAISAGGLSWYEDDTDTPRINGNGGTTTVTLDSGSSVTTSGELGVAVVAASTGGNANTSEAPPDSGENGGSPNSIPTTRAPAGNAGNVTVDANGTIGTEGNVAIGIAAVSSTGGRAVGLLENGVIDQVGPGSGSPGTVTVTNNGTITTAGQAAPAIVALSLGGPGGVLDTRPGLLNLLGNDTAGNGADGNTVSVTNTGSIGTAGAASIGIVAESIGGGGGTATGTGGIIAVGSNGGAGGSGGTVNVTQQASGALTTTGDGAIGILAHSIGGGGGNGGNATGLAASVGGAAGAAGSGGQINVTLNGSVTTGGDFASGLVAQSIGGGGGNGGYGKTYSPVFLSAAVGGSGGSGGDGGSLTVNNYATITSTGEQSNGLLAQSIGGGGGNGGAANTYQVGFLFAAAVSVGGGGGAGGSGGSVTLYNGYHILTGGADAIGMIAQSVGGGGGNGGSALAKSLAIAGDPEIPTISLDVTVGGTGGASGSGGTVTVTNIGEIFTTGDGSHGILAQSIGGGGGNGGDSTATAKAIEGESPTFKAAVALGGDGASSGDGGTVIVSSNSCEGCVSLISTTGNGAAGIVAQSIGGGGGNGGAGSASTSSPNLGGNTGNGLSLTYGMGGTGGASGAGGSVTVSNGAQATITTTGSGSQGMLAQSIGGGGGNGGGGSADGSGDTLDINVAVGRAGGPGSNGGAVTASNAGSISTGSTLRATDGLIVVTGGDSVGILAQSIGGGGGTGGSSDAAATINPLSQLEDAINTPSDGYSGNVSIGRGGGAGGNGGTVDVTNSGTIVTRGIRAYGALAQSIGGGGGSGGAANAAANSVLGGGDIKTEDGKVSPIGNTYSAAVAVGGGGGQAGSGDTVGVTNSGSILTAGYGAHAIMAQSIGGGGGVGAEGTVNNSTTIGIGGSFSGSGAAAGTGGAITITNTGSIATLGDDAYGILAQSIGGSGGAAGAGCSNSNALTVQGFSASRCLGNGNVGLSGNASSWNDSSDLSLTVGGSAGSSGDGGTVTVDVDSGSIVTTGARAIAIVAQSVGGGGGLVAANALNIGSVALRGESLANEGGNVLVTLGAGAGIFTSGAGAWGVLAQSVGGGGGFAGDPSLNLGTPQNGATAGAYFSAGGEVQLTLDGNIFTTGANAHGVVAQSVGGGGGLAGGGGQDRNAILEASGNAGAGGLLGIGGEIMVNQGSGSRIVTTGVGSIGIFVHSAGGPISAPSFVTVSGTVIGGTNNGYDFGNGGIGAAGILLSSNSTANVITVETGGLVSTVDGINGTAILAPQTAVTIQNAGTITGSIVATAGTLANVRGGVLNTGSTLDVPGLTNAGTVNPFGSGVIGASTLSGNFTQGSTGNLIVDIDPQTGRADLLEVAGTASLAGAVTPVPLSLMPGSARIISAAGGITGNVTLPSSLLFQWNGSFSGGNTAYSISANANFAPSGVSLTTSQQSLANNFASAWANADPSFASKFAYLSQINSPSAYAAVLEALSPKATQAQLAAVVNNAGTMLGAAMSCPVFVEQSMLLGEDGCAWAKVTGQWTNQTTNGDIQGYQVSGVTYRLGAQHAFAPDWYVGASFGVSQTWATTDGGSTSSGQFYDGSVSLKHTMGPWLFAGALTFAGGSFHTDRVVGLPGGGGLAPVNATLQSDQSFFLAGGRLRAAYELAFSNWYLRPYADFDVIHTDAPGFQESGRNDFALTVNGNSHTSVAFSPMVEFGGKIAIGDMTLRPYLSAGARFLPDNRRWVDATLFGALPGTGTFRSYSELPAVLASVDVGLQLYRAGSFEARAEYGVKGANGYLGQTAAARIAYHF